MVDISKIAPEGSATRTPQPVEPAQPSKGAKNSVSQRQQKSLDTERLEAQARAKAQQQMKKEDAQEWAEAANNLLDTLNVHLKFQLHEASDRWAIQLIDDKTGDVLREFPPKEILEMAARLRKFMDTMAERHQAVGVLVDHKG